MGVMLCVHLCLCTGMSVYVSVGVLWLPVTGSGDTGTVGVALCDNVYVFVYTPGCLCMCLLVFCGYRSQDLERQKQSVSRGVIMCMSLSVYLDVCACAFW